MRTREEVIKHFTYHPPVGDQAERYEKIRTAAREFALIVFDLMPECPDRTVAMRQLNEAVMAMNQTIACNE